MKTRGLLIICILAASGGILSAQKVNVINKGDSYLKVGIGTTVTPNIGYWSQKVIGYPLNGPIDYLSIMVPFNISNCIYSFGKSSSLSLGGNFMYALFPGKQSNKGELNAEPASTFYVAPELLYHYTLINACWEIYGGASFGYLFGVSEESWGGAFSYKIALGSTYYFNQKFGIYTELGFPYAASVGIAIKW